jgi:FAD binding domain
MIGHLSMGRANSGGPALAALFWSLKPENHGRWVESFARWRDETARLWPATEPALTSLNGPEDFTLARYVQFSIRRPLCGPVVLIGDAAHATSPQLGQGANNALLDSLALCDALERFKELSEAFGRLFTISPASCRLLPGRQRALDAVLSVRFAISGNSSRLGFSSDDDRALSQARDDPHTRGPEDRPLRPYGSTVPGAIRLTICSNDRKCPPWLSSTIVLRDRTSAASRR